MTSQIDVSGNCCDGSPKVVAEQDSEPQTSARVSHEQIGNVLAGRQLKSVVVAFNCARYLVVGSVGITVNDFDDEDSGPRFFDALPLPSALGVMAVHEEHWTGIFDELAKPDVDVTMLPHARFSGAAAWPRLLGGLRHGFTPQFCGDLDWDDDRYDDWGICGGVDTVAFRDGCWSYCDLDEVLDAAGLQLDPDDHEVDGVVCEGRDTWFIRMPHRLPRDENDTGGFDTTSADAIYARQIEAALGECASIPETARQEVLLVLEFEDGASVELIVRSMTESQAVAELLANVLGATADEPEDIDFDQIGPALVWPHGNLEDPDPRFDPFRDRVIDEPAGNIELARKD